MSTSKQRHVIKKQILELELSSKNGAFELQNQIGKIYRDKIVPLIDTYCSQFSSPDAIDRINRLELDIGKIDINNLEQDLIQKVEAQIKQQLSKKIKPSNLFSSSPKRSPDSTSDSNFQKRSPDSTSDSNFQKRSRDSTSDSNSQERSQPTTSNSNSPKRSRDTTSDSNSPKRSPDSTSDSNSQQRSPDSTSDSNSQQRSPDSTSDLETISYFIQTGTLPWYAEKLSKQELDKCFDRLIETYPDQVKRLLVVFFKEQNYLKRIIYQFADATLIKITKLFSVKLAKFITNYNQEIQQILSQVDNYKHISVAKSRLQRWQGILLSFTFNQNTQFEPNQFVKENLLHLSTSFSLNYTSLINDITKTVERIQKENKATFKSQLPKIISQIQVEISQPNTDQEKPLSTQTQLPDSQDIQSDPFSDADEIYINNSGLILLWPFYKQLFTKIGLLQKNNFIDTNAAQKAVLILQYLVDGNTEIPESNLPLNKILCGIDISEPIETSLNISDAEIEECETLLAAAIANWSILKNTSIDGLRKTFLQRNGILRIRHGSWLLQVERQTYDILLDKIPWSIRVIKLSWIDEILYVEWYSNT